MNQKLIGKCIDGVYSEASKKKYTTNKTNVYHLDDTWSLDVLG